MVVFLTVFLAAASGLLAAEEILDFASRIVVEPAGALTVTEQIRVRAEGNEIKRGIYRDFPTLYRGPLGLRQSVPFEVVGVTRDGAPEPWFIEKRGNGVRVYIGSENVMLEPGEHTYTITYRTGRQLGYFDSHDELYWNVTGNGWAFPILKASACVELPPGANPIEAQGYTGPQGSTERNCRTAVRAGCDAFLETTVPLQPGEGFTIVVTWPKGFVSAPDNARRLWDLLAANRGLLGGVAGMLLVAVYFLVAWILRGRDPGRGTIIPLYAPPAGLQPQDVRYLEGLGTCDDRSFAAAVLHLAVAGGLKIDRLTDGTYSLEKGSAKNLEEDDRAFHDALFSHTKSLLLVQANHKVLQSAKRVLATGVRAKNRTAFHANTGLWVAGLVLALIPLGISLMDAANPPAAIFMLLWLSIWSAGCAALATGVASAWRKHFLLAIPAAVFAIPFFAGWVVGAFMLVMAASLWVTVIFLANLGLCGLFHHLLKQPTRDGQALRDKIEGFKHYLSVAEAERLELENPPERTPELFERFLPYALALDVEQKWSENFADVLSRASYKPDWYAASGSAFAAATFAVSLGSGLSGAISSASTAPGSRGGSGGGGSSGGGGGGGGGGGW